MTPDELSALVMTIDYADGEALARAMVALMLRDPADPSVAQQVASTDLFASLALTSGDPALDDLPEDDGNRVRLHIIRAAHVAACAANTAAQAVVVAERQGADMSGARRELEASPYLLATDAPARTDPA